MTNGTSKTRAAIDAEITTLLADNGTGAITAANLRTVVGDINQSALDFLTDAVAPITLAGVLLSNGTGLTTDTTAGHTFVAQAYDTTNTTYRTFETFTVGTTPSLAIAAPVNGTVTINGASIGNVTPGTGAFTTINGTSIGNVTPGTGAFTTTTLSGDVTLANGIAIKPDTTTAHTAKLSAYYTTGSAYEALATLTNGTVPNLTLAASAHGTVTLTDVINSGCKRSSAQLDATSNITLAAITGLSVSLAAGATYRVYAHLPCTSGASGGVKVSFDTSDTLTLTSSDQTAYILNTGVSNVMVHSTAGLTTGLGATQVAMAVELEATLVVNAAGTLIVKGAQNASNGTTSSFYVGGTITVIRIA